MKKQNSLRFNLALVPLLAGLLAQNAPGSGFAIYETSARGLAMGNADSARAADASTLYTNPAAMTSLKGTQVTFGATAIMPDMRVTNYGTPTGDQITPLNNYTAVAPNFYVTHALTNRLSIGFAEFTQYGLKSTFPENWPGTVNNYYTDIVSFTLNPNIAYKLIEKNGQSLSLAAGLQVMYFDVTISKSFPSAGTPVPSALTDLTRRIVLEGDNIGYGWNLALQYELNRKFAIGLTYRSEVKQDLDEATADVPGYMVGDYTPGARHTGVPASGKIVLPKSASIGATYTPNEKWLVAAQALWTGWSSFDALNIYIDGTLYPSEKKWSDTWRYSIGVEHYYNEFITLRGGFVWDCDPVPAAHADFLVPSNDRRIYSLGIGLNFTPNFHVDFSYAVIFIDSRTIEARPADGIPYKARIDKGHANIVSLSANWKF
ncbi:MAG: OmpP1/FadL family transporter [Opitutaceae bacterium]|nr:OmpP1/FadL family transporter [Opitutaceae bacterium]